MKLGILNHNITNVQKELLVSLFFALFMFFFVVVLPIRECCCVYSNSIIFMCHKLVGFICCGLI